MKKFIILSGIPGSGKSSLIAEFQKYERNRYIIVSKDEIRFSIFDSKRTKIYFDESIENVVGLIANNLIDLALDLNQSIIIDETNESVELRIELYEKVIGKDYLVEIHQFSNFRKAKKQNRERERVVPLSVMNRKIRNYEHFSLFEQTFCSNQFIEIKYFNYQ